MRRLGQWFMEICRWYSRNQQRAQKWNWRKRQWE